MRGPIEDKLRRLPPQAHTFTHAHRSTNLITINVCIPVVVLYYSLEKCCRWGKRSIAHMESLLA